MIKTFFKELRRREVLKVAVAYVVIAWGILESGALIFETLQLPAWSARLLLALLVLCFPIALLFSWIYQVDADGIHLEREPEELDEGDAAAAELPDDLSIAVLPFDDLGSDRSRAYIGEGLAEGILNLLARVPDLRVISRTSSFAFRDQGKTVAEIARELGVAYVLEGSLRQSEDTLRVVAQLIRASDDSHLYSDSYDITMRNLLRLEDEIAAKVTDKLKVALLTEKARELEGNESESHVLYLRGSQMLWSGKLSELRGAIEVLTRATEIDPGHANAHALLGYAHMLSCSDPQADRKLENALLDIARFSERALELDPDSEHANLAMAMYQMAAKNWEASQSYFLRSISINPSYSRALGYYSYFLCNTRRMERGIFWANRAIAADPFSAHELVRHAQIASYTGDQEAALESAHKALEIQPGYGTAYIWLVGIYGQLGDHQAAIDAMCRWNLVDMRLTQKEEAEFSRVLRDEGTQAYLAHWYAWLLKKRERGARSPHLAWFLGLYATLNGRVEEALDHLEEAWTQTVLVPDLIYFQGLRGHPRWQALLEKYHLRDEDVEELERAAARRREELGLSISY